MKRLIVACDGTWDNSDDGFVRSSWLPWKTSEHLATPSNVTRICRALQPRSDDGVSQIVFYQAGVGSDNNWYSFFLGGYLGDGLVEHVREAYAFLCNNYEDGDEIVLIGFSRGAFTARSIGGLIGDIGLLTKKGLGSFYPIFKDWMNQVNASYKPEIGTAEWPLTRPKFTNPSYIPKLVEQGLTRPAIPIKAIGVWETVGILGVPEIRLLGLKLFAPAHKELSFINTEVPANVEYAYHALALDEDRRPYSPTLWETPNQEKPSSLKLLKQCWFPGVHSSVGGGYEDTSVSDVTLAWMITQLSRHLTFDPQYILRQQEQNVRYYEDHDLPIASWAMGQIQRSDTGVLNAILGKQVRTPGQYHYIDPVTGKPTPRRLVNTCEFMHPSVRYRIQQHGPGLAKSTKDPGQGTYEPQALSGWDFVAPGEPLRDDSKLDIWNDAGRWDEYGKWIVTPKDGNTTFIAEERLQKGSEEAELVDAWPGVYETVTDL